MDSSSEKTFAVLRLHDWRLSLPQEEIVNLNVASDVSVASETGDGSVGELDCQGQILPLFSLSEELDLVNERPQDQNICASIAIDGVPSFSLSCSVVTPMQLDLASVFPMPDPMDDNLGLLRGLVISENSILFTSSALALQSHISRYGDRHE